MNKLVFSSLSNILLHISLFFFTSTIVNANQADVINVKATQAKDNTWRFDVTVKHADEGWDHYANEWVVLTPDNKVIAKRTLYHPHVDEQPFTRNLQGVKIPDNIKEVTIVARDSVHGIKGKSMTINLAGDTSSSKVSRIDSPDL